MTTKTILITRPKGDEKAITDMLHARDFRVIHEPLTDIYLRHTERLAIHQALMDDPDAVLCTSRHAVHALALLTDLRDAFLLCVGEATADAAYSLGFTRVDVAGGTVQSMIEKIAAVYDEGTRFLYPSGAHARVELDAVLEQMGMQCQRVIVYDALAATELSDILLAQLQRKQIDAVTFLSPRAAQIFSSLLAKADAQTTVAHMRAVCISEATANLLENQPWKAIHIASEATLASVVECVDNVFA